MMGGMRERGAAEHGRQSTRLKLVEGTLLGKLCIDILLLWLDLSSESVHALGRIAQTIIPCSATVETWSII